MNVGRLRARDAMKAVAVIVIVFAASASPSSAGVLQSTQNCPNMSGPSSSASAYCRGVWTTPGYQNIQSYVRFGTESSFDWYPSHRVYGWVQGPNLASWTYGAWTSARFAYSPIHTAYYWDINGQLNTSTTEKRNYKLLFFSGAY